MCNVGIIIRKTRKRENIRESRKQKTRGKDRHRRKNRNSVKHIFDIKLREETQKDRYTDRKENRMYKMRSVYERKELIEYVKWEL